MNFKQLAKKIYSKKTIKDINKKIKLLGPKAKYDTYTFLNIRLFGTIIIFLIFLFTTKLGFMIGPLLAFLYYKFITYILLDYNIKLRTTTLEREAINFFEILALSIETGRNLNEALNVTVASSEGELSLEFKEVLREVKYGKSLTEALEDMEKRVPTDTINNIVLSLTQADLYGTSIITSLHNQIEYLRNKRIMEVKAEISKVPIKISIISVFFFVPLILIIILAPVLLGYLGG
ncbi:MAG: type II secretion system F family protein [Bacilli bacterium]|nr:type II secretion system F family protein [Bacilli bacterium]